MKCLSLAWKSSLFATLLALASVAQAADWGETDTSVLPGRAIGLLEGADGSACTAFLSGVWQIATAGHCVLVGTDGLRFKLHSRNGYASANATFTGMFVTGGGGLGNSNEQFLGQDWAILEISEPLGKTFGYLPLWPGDVPTGTNIYMNAYAKGWRSGQIPRSSQCTVQDPSEDFKPFCTEKDGQTICNFFLHDCPTDAEGFDSGAPITAVFEQKDENGKSSWNHYVVGILTGRTSFNRPNLAAKVMNWGMTVNPTEERASDVYSHALALDTFSYVRWLSQAIPNAASFQPRISAIENPGKSAVVNYAVSVAGEALPYRGFRSEDVMHRILNVNGAHSQWSLNTVVRRLYNATRENYSNDFIFDPSALPESISLKLWSPTIRKDTYTRSYSRYYTAGKPVDYHDSSKYYSWTQKYDQEKYDRQVAYEEQQARAKRQWEEQQARARQQWENQQAEARRRQQEYQEQLRRYQQQQARYAQQYGYPNFVQPRAPQYYSGGGNDLGDQIKAHVYSEINRSFREAGLPPIGSHSSGQRVIINGGRVTVGPRTIYMGR